MSPRTWIALAGLVAVAVAAWLFSPLRGGPQETALSPGGVQEEAGARAPQDDSADDDPAHRAAIAEPETATPAARSGQPAEVPAAADGGRLREVAGRVLDPTGDPVSQLAVVAAAHPDAELGTTLADGSFRVELARGLHELEARGDGWSTVRAAVVDSARPEAEALVVVAPAVELEGRVVDESGAGVPQANLWVEEDWRGIDSFPLPLDRAQKRRAEVRADGGGRFLFERAPRLPGGSLQVGAEGFETRSLPVPARSKRDMEIELARAPLVGEGPQAEPILFGTVRFPDGRPVEGALVQLVGASATSDELGRWELEVPGTLPEWAVLAAMLDGWQPAVRDDFRAVIALGGLRVGPVELTLPGTELAIAGRLELADGSPAAGWKVQLLDPTVLDEHVTPFPTLERRGATAAASDWPTTGEAGRFQIVGLRDRSYRLRLWQAKTHLSVESGPVAAGTEDLELRLPADAVLPRLEGRVLTRDGEAVPGAQVALRFVVERSRTGFTWQTPAHAFTEADGSFALEGVPRRGVEVVVSAESIEELVHEPENGELPETPLELRAWRRVHVRFDFSGMDPVPDELRLLDALEEQLDLETRTASGYTKSTSLRLRDGRSPVVSVSERAATLVLLREWKELERRPLQLAQGEVNEIGP